MISPRRGKSSEYCVAKALSYRDFFPYRAKIHLRVYTQGDALGLWLVAPVG